MEFLSDDQAAVYAQFNGDPSRAELERFFFLDDAVRQRRHRGDHNRVGFAVQLGTVRFLGAFLTDWTTTPRGVVQYVADQVAPDADVDRLMSRYMEREKTPLEHSWEIRESLGYRDFGAAEAAAREFLEARAWTRAERPSQQFDQVVAWLRTEKVLLPGAVDPRRHRIPRRRWQPPRHAGLPDLSVDHRDAALLPRQEPFADRLGDDRLHPAIQPTPSPRIRARRHEVSRAARAGTKPLRQNVHLAAGNSQFGSCLVDRCHPAATPAPANVVRTPGQAMDDLSLPQHPNPPRGKHRQCPSARMVPPRRRAQLTATLCNARLGQEHPIADDF